MISPFKGAIGEDYKRIEHALHEAIHRRFGLPPLLPAKLTAMIKLADRTAAFSEAVDLAGFSESEARRVLGYRRKARSAPLAPLPPDEAKSAFLRRFHQLYLG